MKIIVFILGLLFLVSDSSAQVKAPSAWESFSLSNVYMSYNREFNLFNNYRLFDLSEIKRRKIKTAIIIQHPMSWAEYDTLYNKMTNRDNTPPWSDTTFIYKFDEEGRIIQITTSKIPSEPTIDDYDSLGNKIASTKTYHLLGGKIKTTNYKYSKDSIIKKVDSSEGWTTTRLQKLGKDSLVTSTTFKKVKNKFDTIFINISKYNNHGLVIEEEFKVNQKNYKEAALNIECGVSNWHYKYNYDKEGRVTFFRNFDSTEYKRISYPFYGMLIETFDLKANSLKKREINLLTVENGTVRLIYNNRDQLILTPIEPKSKLYKLQTFIKAGDFPIISYNEIVYLQ